MRLLLRPIVLLVALGGFVVPSMAQDEIDNLLRGSRADAQKLVGAYVSPLMKSMALGLNQGWYNTAKPHKIAGFDATVTINLMAAPNDELMYNVASLGLSTIELDDSSPDPDHAPTIFGPEQTPIFRLTDTDETFEGPQGLDLKNNIPMGRMPVPMAHFGFGLPKGTDVKLRWAPTLEYDGSTFKLFGIGVMHDIKQWIPGIKLLPFDLSGFVGYTKIEAETVFNENDPDNKGLFTMNATTVQGVISKKFSILTLYGGAGYNVAKSNIAIKGEYEIAAGETINDPVDLSFAASGPRMTAGMRLKLAILTLHADYTVQKYSCLTVGLGLSVR